MGRTSDFDTIHVSVDVEGNLIPPFIKRVFLHDELTRKAAILIRSYGFECEEGPIGQLGGGLIHPLWETIKEIWANRHYVTLAMGIIGHIRSLALQHQRQQLADSKPRLIIHIGVQSSQTLPETPTNDQLKRLTLIKHISDAVLTELNNSYSAISFRQHVYLAWGHGADGYQVNFDFNTDSPSAWATWRMMRIVRGLVTRRNHIQTYRFGSFMVRRTDSTIMNVQRGQKWYHYAPAKYYLIISTHVLRDHFSDMLVLRRKKVVKTVATG